jgi:flagellar biosynthesis/type III secretory pathway M-ring protein FliF/YscJ
MILNKYITMSAALADNIVENTTTPLPAISPLIDIDIVATKSDDKNKKENKENKENKETKNTIYTYILGAVVICLIVAVLYGAYSKYQTNQDDDREDDKDDKDTDDTDSTKPESCDDEFSIDTEVEKLNTTQQQNLTKLKSQKS